MTPKKKVTPYAKEASKEIEKVEVTIESATEEATPVIITPEVMSAPVVVAPVVVSPIKVEFYLPDEKIQVRFIKKQSGYIKNPSHVAYGGMLEGTMVSLPAKEDRAGNYIPVLSKDEQAGLEKLMQVDEGYLSPHKVINNFWDTQTVGLSKEGLHLDLNNPYDFIKYKMLLTYEDYISPSIHDTHTKRSYRFELVRKEDENMASKAKIDYKRKAYMILGKIEDSREALAGAVRILSGRTVSTTNHDFLISEVGELIEQDSKRFVTLLEDPLYKIKLFIEMAISAKQITKNRNRYASNDGVELCEEGEVPTLDNTIKFLSHDKNQDIKLAIEAGMVA
jgi:hypothetical protein